MTRQLHQTTHKIEKHCFIGTTKFPDEFMTICYSNVNILKKSLVELKAMM